MDDSRSRSGVIGPVQEGSGGLILCYAQALGVVVVRSLLIEFSERIKTLLWLQGAVSLISIRVWVSGNLGNHGKVPQVLGTSRKWSRLRLSFHNSEIGAEVREGDKNLD